MAEEMTDAEIQKLADDAMETWRKGILSPDNCFIKNNKGKWCGCFITAAAICRDPSILTELQREDGDVEAVIEKAVAVCGLSHYRNSVIKGFDFDNLIEWEKDTGGKLCRMANAVRKTVFATDEWGRSRPWQPKTAEELQKTPTPTI